MSITLNMMVGPPKDKSLDRKAVELFLERADRYVACGGSTAGILLSYVGSDLVLEPCYPEKGLMSYGTMGDIIVTEGVITLCAVADYFSGKRNRPKSETGAGKLIEMLEISDSVRIVFGTAVNPLHMKNSSLFFENKEKSLECIKSVLESMGKKVEIIKF